MKKVSKSKMIREIAISYHKDSGNIIIGNTRAEFEKREIANALAHIYGYG